MRRKGRGFGSLTPEQVREIRAALKNRKHGMQNELAERYGVDKGVISDLRHGRSYQEVT